jgi:addiction module RelB/DinJ family antitoxin
MNTGVMKMNSKNKSHKNTTISIRISQTLKEQFYEICQKKGVNPSDFLRSYIIQIVQEEKRGN